MKFLRKITVIQAFILCLVLILLSGCKKKPLQDEKWWGENGNVKILTTIAMINDLVGEIGGEHVDTMPLIRGELDPHSYELVKGDDEKFARADLIFYNGLGLEHGLSLRQQLECNPKAISVAESMLNDVPSPVLVVDGEYDPHVWMDISLWVRTINPIVDALCAKDPMHAKEYCQRAQCLREKMEAADRQAYETLQAIPDEKRYLVTSHDAFGYFVRRYLSTQQFDWKERCAAPEGLAPEAQLSVTDILEIMDHVKKYQISVLFPESNVSKDSLSKILNAAKEKGHAIHLCQDPLYGDSMGDATSYLEMIDHNVSIIARELMYEHGHVIDSKS